MKNRFAFLLLICLFTSSLTSCNAINDNSSPNGEVMSEIFGIEKELIFDSIFKSYLMDFEYSSHVKTFPVFYPYCKQNQKQVYELTMNNEYDIICGYLPKDSPSLKIIGEKPSMNDVFHVFYRYHSNVGRISLNDLSLYSLKSNQIQYDLGSHFLLFAYLRLSFTYNGVKKYHIHDITYDVKENNFLFDIGEYKPSLNAKLLFFEEDFYLIKTYYTFLDVPYSSVAWYDHEKQKNYVISKPYYTFEEGKTFDELFGDYIIGEIDNSNEHVIDTHKDDYQIDYERVKELLNIIEYIN